MENAADALKIAAAVLIFVVALSISINAFGEARIVSRTILDYKDREYNYTYVEESNSTERIVSLENIVPSIYKAYKENYKIVFRDSRNSDGATNLLGNDGIYRRRNEIGDYVGVYNIDLQNEVLGSNSQKEQFIMSILYGNKYEDFSEVKQDFVDNLGIYLNEIGIYDKIRSSSYARNGLKESLGIYYQEETPSELITDGGTEVSGDDIADSVPDANKTIKRVLTYTIPD